MQKINTKAEVRFIWLWYQMQDLHAIYIWSKVYELLQHESNLKKNLGSSTYLQPLFRISVIGASLWFSKLWSLLRDDVLLKEKPWKDKFGTKTNIYKTVASHQTTLLFVICHHYQEFVEHAP